MSSNTFLRRFRTAYVEVARKNGKSVMLAGTALYALALEAANCHLRQVMQTAPNRLAVGCA
jgi:phage terminase large subunit-like protein